MTAADDRLSWRCELCKAPPNTECVNTITPGRPLPGRRFHHGRAYPPDRQKRKGAA